MRDDLAVEDDARRPSWPARAGGWRRTRRRAGSRRCESSRRCGRSRARSGRRCGRAGCARGRHAARCPAPLRRGSRGSASSSRRSTVVKPLGDAAGLGLAASLTVRGLQSGAHRAADVGALRRPAMPGRGVGAVAEDAGRDEARAEAEPGRLGEPARDAGTGRSSPASPSSPKAIECVGQRPVLDARWPRRGRWPGRRRAR